MNSWSARRKRFIFFLVLFALIILVGLPAGFLFYEPPNCFDKKQNGGETGVDCGGSCELICSAESLPIITKGDPRVLEVAPNFFEIVALVENPNASARAEKARYTIKLYESAGITPVRIIEGETFVPRSSTFALFEGPFEIEGAKPTRAILEWKNDTLVWQKDTFPEPSLSIKNVELTRASTEPRVTAALVNDSLSRVSNIELIALISDEGGNIVAAAKTIAESLEAGESVSLIFVWPRPLVSESASVDVLWRVFPDRSYIR